MNIKKMMKKYHGVDLPDDIQEVNDLFAQIKSDKIPLRQIILEKSGKISCDNLSEVSEARKSLKKLKDLEEELWNNIGY